MGGLHRRSGALRILGDGAVLPGVACGRSAFASFVVQSSATLAVYHRLILLHWHMAAGRKCDLRLMMRPIFLQIARHHISWNARETFSAHVFACSCHFH